MNKTPPAVFLIHAAGGTEPIESVAKYAAAMKEKGAEVWVHIYPGIDHELTDRHMMDAGRKAGRVGRLAPCI